jgi:AcrR family transcriptional regulator
MKASDRESTRREPKQERSRQTVDAVLQAVPRVLRRHGAGAITTNRIAEAAGVSSSLAASLASAFMRRSSAV